MSQKIDLLSQFQMIKATFHDHQKTIPFPPEIMFGWSVVSSVLIFGTPFVLHMFNNSFIIIGLFYISSFIMGIALEYFFLKRANSYAGIHLSPTQKYILKTHAVGGFFGILMTLIFVQYSIVELLYIFWIFWIGLAVFIIGFLTKELILKTGLLIMSIGIVGFIILIYLKSSFFTSISKESFFTFTMYLSFLAISLTHIWMGLELKKVAHV